MKSMMNSPNEQDGVFKKFRAAVSHLMMPPLELLPAEWQRRMAMRRQKISALERIQDEVRREGLEAAATLMGMHSSAKAVTFGQTYFERIEQVRRERDE